MILNTPYQQYIFYSRYSRWRDEDNRRETWPEAVKRYIDFFKYRHEGQIADNTWSKLEKGIINLDVMPSMRALMTAGPALDRDNVAGYNCAYLAINRLRAFDEIMYLLMCGTGVGFSVERQYINSLPGIPENLYETDTTIHVADSRIGWARALKELISILYSGHIPKWDLSKVRAKGERLKTFGGRSSGPEPLDDLFRFVVETFKLVKDRKLNSIECHDIICKIADIVIVGGVRRSALLSLSNLTDERMAKAKAGQWWVTDPQRALANNSVCYTERPDIGIFVKEALNLWESKSGERGIFNRVACQRKAERIGRDGKHDFGTNPCSEIILRDRQLCNLSEVIIRNTDDFEDVKRKVELATILGTLQSTLTDFRYLSHKWKENCEEERLLGVSLTGIMDHEEYSNQTLYPKDQEQTLKDLKDEARKCNKKYSTKLGINPSAAITCVKPSGTVSQLVDSSSGIHPRYSPFYIRRVISDRKDPIAQFMIDHGVPYEEHLQKPEEMVVFKFPMASPDNSVCRGDLTPITQLEHWKNYAEYWCEHKPSVSIYYPSRGPEFLQMMEWVYRNFDQMSGISFFPETDHVYAQAPYEEIKEEEYKELIKHIPVEIDWSKLCEYETEDTTTVEHELACSAGACEL